MDTKITNDENATLIVAAQNGSEEAISDLIKLNTNLVHHVAQRFPVKSERFSYDDLTQEGMLGLLDAVKSYDVSSGVKFSTYAYNLIRFKILNFISGNSSAFYIPKGTTQIGAAINKFIEEKALNGDVVPSLNEIAQHVGVGPDVVSFFTDKQCVNLADSPYEGCKYEETIPDTSPTPDLVYEKQALSEDVAKVINKKLDSEEKYILLSHFGFNGYAKTFSSIAKEFGVSTQSISTKYKNALRKLKVAFATLSFV